MITKKTKKASEREIALSFLYRTAPGRVCLKVACAPLVSRVIGKLLDSPASAVIIDPFIKRTGIDIDMFEKRPYRSYNDFFTRNLVTGARIIDSCPEHLIAPCDGKLSVYRINHSNVFSIKNTLYSLADLLRDRELAAEFSDGICLIFRLCVDDYHRYSFFDAGVMSHTRCIKGQLHTVRPIAFEKFNVYKHNCREYSVLKTENFGTAVQIEVGAMLVGKIVNNKDITSFSRGDEKGYFEYGGSTIVLLLKKDVAVIDPHIIENTSAGTETAVKLGEKIGVKGSLS